MHNKVYHIKFIVITFVLYTYTLIDYTSHNYKNLCGSKLQRTLAPALDDRAGRSPPPPTPTWTTAIPPRRPHRPCSLSSVLPPLPSSVGYPDKQQSATGRSARCAPRRSIQKQTFMLQVALLPSHPASDLSATQRKSKILGDPRHGLPTVRSPCSPISPIRACFSVLNPIPLTGAGVVGWLAARLLCRRDSFITHRAFCDALAEESSKARHLLRRLRLRGSSLHRRCHIMRTTWVKFCTSGRSKHDFFYACETWNVSTGVCKIIS
jgi:hypothetical protein